jgi:hypothetical protein
MTVAFSLAAPGAAATIGGRTDRAGAVAAGSAAPIEGSHPDEGAAAAREDIRRALASFAQPVSWRGVAAFLADAALYAGFIAGVLFLPSLALKLACSVLAGEDFQPRHAVP